MKNDSMVMFWYEHMRELVKQLYPWYNIDKIKPWGVYVWTKDSSEDELDGENVFDIYANEVAMYNEMRRPPLCTTSTAPAAKASSGLLRAKQS